MLHGLSAFVSALSRGPVAGLALGAVLLPGPPAGSLPGLPGAAVLAGQEGGFVEVVREENLRATPNGVLLGRLGAGTLLERVGGLEEWVEVELEGWVWTRSMQIADRDGFDLVISENGGENLRVRPRGPAAGRLVQGTFLQEEERVPGWIRVRRRGWIWRPSVRSIAVEAPEPQRDEPDAGAAMPGPETDPAPAPLGHTLGYPLLSAPDGDTLARVRSDASLSVEEREGGWVRVRVDGWIWLPDSTAAAPGPVDVSPAEVVAEPARWRGRTVTWRLQFISLEQAESVRTDFREGEPFLLTRSQGDSDAPLVYVALPPEMAAAGEALSPLERITVTGRIRTGASVLTGSPIVDLVELRRGSGR